MRHNIELEDDNTAVPRSHIDDEYAHAGERDPKVLITTSRDPSSRLTQFAKELKLVVPNAQRINRGGQVGISSSRPSALRFTALGIQDHICLIMPSPLRYPGYVGSLLTLHDKLSKGKMLSGCMQIISELVNTCRNHDFTDIVIVHEHRGEPDGLVVCHLPYGPTAFFGIYNTVSLLVSVFCSPVACRLPSEGICSLSLVREVHWVAITAEFVERHGSALRCRSCFLQVLRHDIGEKKKVGTISEAYPHLIVNHFSSKLGERVGNILKYLFPAPKVRAYVCFSDSVGTAQHIRSMTQHHFAFSGKSHET